MVEYRYMRGWVYILENVEAQRVKVGVTISSVALRLGDVNDMWSGWRVTCQICGGRLNRKGRRVPHHVVNGKDCEGSNGPPLEEDVTLAESHLAGLRLIQDTLSGAQKGSVTTKIKTLEKRIERFRNRARPVGTWQFSAAFFTEAAEQVELLSHEILAHRLDEKAPFGEVFRCSVSEAVGAIEAALEQLGLLATARKETRLRHGRANPGD